MASLGELLPVKANDVTGLVKAAADVGAELVVVGPEDPLALGLADALKEKGIKVFGPGKAGAMLEADKAFSKKMMRDASIPTAEGRVLYESEIGDGVCRDAGGAAGGQGGGAGEGEGGDHVQ